MPFLYPAIELLVIAQFTILLLPIVDLLHRPVTSIIGSPLRTRLGVYIAPRAVLLLKVSSHGSLSALN